MKTNLKFAGKTLLRLLLATIMCAFLSLAMSVITIGVFGDNVGYRIMQQDEEGKTSIVKEHYYEEGEKEIDKDKMKLEKNQWINDIRDTSAGTQTFMDILTLILSMILFAMFPYNLLWEMGDKDLVNVRYRGAKADPCRGLKIGLLVDIPYLLLYGALVAAKLGILEDGFLPLFRLILVPFLPFINLVIPNIVVAASDLAVWQLLCLIPTVLVVPAVCGLAYYLGSAQISLHERFTYKGIKKEQEKDSEI